MSCQNSDVSGAVDRDVWLAVSGAVWGVVDVDVIVNRAFDLAVWGAVTGAVWRAVDGTMHDPVHPALEDFLRSAAAGVGAV